MTTIIYKIPPNLPLPKGGFSPLFGKVGTTRNREGCGEIFWINVNSIMRLLISQMYYLFLIYSLKDKYRKGYIPGA